jgi:H+/Cl- antiporter ClcA
MHEYDTQAGRETRTDKDGWTRLPRLALATGSAGFLAVSMDMPVTAVVLVFEFTRFGHDIFFPVLFAVAGATATSRFLGRSPIGLGSARRRLEGAD